MADIIRTASAVWDGDLKSGKGKMTAASGAFEETPYSFATRFESSPGTNPEELLAAAHAACFSMALSGALGKQGLHPESIQTKAACHLSPLPGGGFGITKMKIETRGKVSGIDAAGFQAIAAELACPVSNLLKHGLTIEVDATLV